MGIKSFFSRLFSKKPPSRKLQFTVTFKTEPEDVRDGRTFLISEPSPINQQKCYEFRNMLQYDCESVTFIDPKDNTTIKTYQCTAQTDNYVVFINNTGTRENYGKLMFIVQKIDSVGDKSLKVIAEVGDFNRYILGYYRDFALRGQTVTFTLKYRVLIDDD